jgi:hypothetical protein
MICRRVVVIHGPTTYKQQLMEAFKGFPVLYSTWEGEESKYNFTDNVIFNKKPIHTGNTNVGMQQVALMAGFIKAKEQGYNRVVKWRCDMIPTSYSRIEECFQEDVFNVAYSFNNGDCFHYYVDYFMESHIDYMMHVWNFNEYYSEPFTEMFLLKRIKRLPVNIHCMGNVVTPECDVLWLSKNRILSNDFRQTFFKTKIL